MKSKTIFLVTSFLLVVTLVGCEAFVRKFTRKPKTENLPREEMILTPQEYKVPQVSNEDLYQQHFLFWKSWNDELIESLSSGGSHKKQLSCIREAIKNLANLKDLLGKEKQKKLEVYLTLLKTLEISIDKDIYGNNWAANRQAAEQIRRNIARDFPYNKAKKYLSE